MKMKKLFCCAIAVLTLFCGCANGEEDFEDRYTVDGESVVSLSAPVETEPIETDAPVEVVESESETVLETESETTPETTADTTPETLPAIVTPTTPAVVDVPIETVVETEPAEPEPVVIETEPVEPEPVVIETEPPETETVETEPILVETTSPETTAPETTAVEITPETEPETAVPEESTEITYVLNKNTKKFHKPTCASVKKIKAENYEAFTGTRDEAIAGGYDPCKNCKP